MQWKLIHPACGGPAVILNREVQTGEPISASDIDVPPDLVNGMTAPPCITCGDEYGYAEAMVGGIVEPRGDGSKA